MFTYRIVLTRYKDHERRQSAAISVLAKTFYRACEIAERLVQGNQMADPDAEFEIASVRHESLGGAQCSEGWKVPREVEKAAA